MIYDDGVEMNGDMTITICPRCENEQFSDDADFCRICGLSTRNTCEGYWDEYKDYPVEHANPSNARFCETCGKRTTFFNEELLKPWHEAKLEPVQVDEEEEIPF